MTEIENRVVQLYKCADVNQYCKSMTKPQPELNYVIMYHDVTSRLSQKMGGTKSMMPPFSFSRFKGLSNAHNVQSTRPFLDSRSKEVFGPLRTSRDRPSDRGRLRSLGQFFFGWRIHRGKFHQCLSQTRESQTRHNMFNDLDLFDGFM